MPTPTTSTVSNTQTGGSVGPDETLTVTQGGTTIGFTVSGSDTYDGNTPPYFFFYPAVEDVFGVASSSTISNDGSQEIEAGGVAHSTQLAGGTQYISSGGVAYNTSGNGSEVVSAGGQSFDATIDFGSQDVFGSASSTYLSYSNQTVESGGVATDTTVTNSSTLTVSSGGSATSTTIESGGMGIVDGGITNAWNIEANGTETVSSGGSATSTTVESGGKGEVGSGGFTFGWNIQANGTETVDSGGTASGTTVSSGGMGIVDGGITNTWNIEANGTEMVSSGGSATSTTVGSGGKGEVGSGGFTFGWNIQANGTETVDSGGTASGTTVSSGGMGMVNGGITDGWNIQANGTEMVSSGGSATSTTVGSGGKGEVGSGGFTFGWNIQANGTETVDSGGTASGTTVSSGGMGIVDGGITNTWNIQANGTETVSSGGSATSTTVESGGKGEVGPGGFTFGWNIQANGTETVDSGGTASGTTVSSGGMGIVDGGITNTWNIQANGTETVSSGGSATSTTVESGGKGEVGPGGFTFGWNIQANGTETVSSGGSATSTTVESGGKGEVGKGGNGHGWNIQANGTLIVSGGTSEATQLQGGAYVDMANVTYQAGDTAKIVNGYLEIFDSSGNEITVDNSGDPIGQSVGVAAASSSENPGDLPLAALHANAIFADADTSPSFVVTSDGNGDVLIQEAAACYVAGTRIRTPAGDVAIESLQVGADVVTARGDVRSVRWVCHRTIDCGRHPEPKQIWPICISAGAMGDGLPSRDLWVSPGHSLLIEGHLIQAANLVNGITVRQVPTHAVQYWHVELASHDVILAEGVPAETYLDTGNRSAFVDGGAFLDLHPDFQPKHWSDTCYPLALSGPAVTRAKQLLLDRLKQRDGYSVTDDPDVHVVAEGARIEPIWLTPTRMVFLVPSASELIELRSRTWVPAHCLAESADERTLGVCVFRLQADGEVIPLEQCADGEGWHGFESAPDGSAWCWTTGSARLPAGTRIAMVDVGGHSQYRLTAHAHRSIEPTLQRTALSTAA